jgi:hypothetical protein
LGIAGDSLTFAGALLLAAEALWKKTERIAIATKKTVIAYFPDAEDREGNPISANSVEQKWSNIWDFAAKAGAILLVIGFAFLLVCRIFAE